MHTPIKLNLMLLARARAAAQPTQADTSAALKQAASKAIALVQSSGAAMTASDRG
jgi:hypothetical protein